MAFSKTSIDSRLYLTSSSQLPCISYKQTKSLIKIYSKLNEMSWYSTVMSWFNKRNFESQSQSFFKSLVAKLGWIEGLLIEPGIVDPQLIWLKDLNRSVIKSFKTHNFGLRVKDADQRIFL